MQCCPYVLALLKYDNIVLVIVLIVEVKWLDQISEDDVSFVADFLCHLINLDGEVFYGSTEGINYS